MVKPSLEKGSVIDGFLIGEKLHRGGMATLWSVTKPGAAIPMLMKVPMVGEGADPAAIVSFEMEQMILPRVSGIHVPAFVAAGDFGLQPHIVMERIDGTTLLPQINALPLPYPKVAELGWKLANALEDVHRQHVVHHDIKPSNIMFRPAGEAVLVDFGLAFHELLPDLMQEEFRLPYGTAPYMAPERLLGVRDDRRSDLFSLGVLLYFFSTGARPFGETETLRGMKRRLWRDPAPPRQLRPDYPVWLQEIVLRCLEIEPAWRYPTAAQLAFDLTHPGQVNLTSRSERLKRDPISVAWRRRFNQDGKQPSPKKRDTNAEAAAAAPIIAVAVDTTEGAADLNEMLRITADRILATLPSARLACLNVLKQGRITVDTTLDAQGHNKHVDRLVGLRHWAEPLKLEDHRLTVHVLEAIDPASAILEFAEVNRVNHILIGARQSSLVRKLLGSVSARVAAEASCTVTVVRPSRLPAAAASERDSETHADQIV